MKIAAVIPARYESTRFKGKPLAMILHKPMIQWVYEAVLECKIFHEIVVATDHRDIANAVKQFGGNVCMTSSGHRTGTDRVAEVAKVIDAQLIVNIQGDEPTITPQVIEQAVLQIVGDNNIPMGTLKSEIKNYTDMKNPDIVKVVTNVEDLALYFSRSPIPFTKDSADEYFGFKHIGLYVYRRDFLLELSSLRPLALEKAEDLEQLRALEYGYPVKVSTTTYTPIGVDRPEDVKRVESMIKKKQSGAMQ